MLKAIAVSVVSRLIVLGVVLCGLNLYARTSLFGKDGLMAQAETALLSLKDVANALK